MITREYRTNRARFAQSELAKHQGSWVAFRTDGCAIVASAATIEQLEEELTTTGHDAQQIVLEWVAGPEDDSVLGGGELL